MARVTITREVHFSAAHRVFNPEWSDERNFEVFGACANPNWHGHDYVLYVAVEAELDRDTGFVMDFKDLKSVVDSRVVEDMDHKNVNLDVPWMKGVIASAENIVVAIWERLADRLPAGVKLAKQNGTRHSIVPGKYRIGHEAHFGQVTKRYLQYLVDGKLPDWEEPNMIAKYYTNTTALKMASEK